MKRKIFMILVLLLSVLAACSTSEDTTSNEETEETKEESDKDKKSTDEIPNINEEAMNHAYDIINDYDMVKDTHIEVSEEDKKITLAIIVNAATNEEHAKELGDNFARALASGVSIYSEDDLESPSKDNLGELYDSYDLQVCIGTSPDDFIARGAMVTNASKITW